MAASVCDTCGKTFTTKGSLTRHQQVHGEQSFTCDHCDEQFKTAHSRREHISNVHSVKSYACDTCSKVFTCKSYLKQHVKTHNSEKTHECEYCFKTFSTAATLKRHLVKCRIIKSPVNKSHDEKKFACVPSVTITMVTRNTAAFHLQLYRRQNT